MKQSKIITILAASLLLIGMACRVASDITNPLVKTPTPTAASTPTALPSIAIKPGSANPSEPTAIFGEIPYTSPFFPSLFSEPYVMLEDQAGFVMRDRDFEFPLAGQAIGPITVVSDKSLSYQLALPSVPQGTSLDVDNNGKSDPGVQIFAVAFWSNTWGGPFLERRDGTGWSNAYSSTITDLEIENEIQGGTLIVWAPDDEQSFPTGFGTDGLLFTGDDPTAPIPAGYNIVDLDQEPFQVYKTARPEITLVEGAIQVNDFSELSYTEAFDAMFAKVSREYPFTAEKNLDWQALYDQYAPQIAKARNAQDFYRALRDFTFEIPDQHVNAELDPEVFYQENGGGFGLVIAELSDGRVIATDVLPETPAAQAGIQPGAEIISWNGEPVSDAISKIIPALGPYSTDHARRAAQVIFLQRVPPGTSVDVTFSNPEQSQPTNKKLASKVEYDSLFKALGAQNTPILPVEASILQPSGLGYIKINTFMDDTHMTAMLWDRYIKEFIDQEVPGLIIDLRVNGGGDSSLANNFAGYLFDEEMVLYRSSSYNQESGQFEYSPQPARLEPGPLYYEGPVALLIGPDCVSACEGFAYTLSQGNRSILVGHYPTAGAYGGVSLGQFRMPDDLSMQFPTSRSETLDGELIIEGSGVLPTLTVPVTESSTLGQQDTVLDAAIQALLEQLQ